MVVSAGAALAERLLDGEPAALARAISRVEAGAPEALAILEAIHPALGRARSVGVTGPPGAGKSTLVNALVHALRAARHRVAVVAVDPSSPVSGGAILGDRVRMADHDLDPDVFIRSLASRGERGGLSVAAGRVIDLMDAAGYDRVVLETVGAGQAEIDIAELADARVVVCAPGLGDDVQALKAGVLEIADVLVVNKCDLPLAGKTARELEGALALRRVEPGADRGAEGAEVPVLETSATEGRGIDALAAAIDAALARAPATVEERARRRMRRVIAKAAARAVEERVLAAGGRLDALCDAVHRGAVALDDAAARFVLAEPSVDV